MPPRPPPPKIRTRRAGTDATVRIRRLLRGGRRKVVTKTIGIDRATLRQRAPQREDDRRDRHRPHVEPQPVVDALVIAAATKLEAAAARTGSRRSGRRRSKQAPARRFTKLVNTWHPKRLRGHGRRTPAISVTPVTPDPRRRRSAPRTAATRVRMARWRSRRRGLAARLRGGRASVFPGYVALRVAPDLLTTLLADRPVCFVSGTNGKTTTTALIAAALGADVDDQSRRRQPPGRLGAGAARRDPGTGPAVLEVDEAYLPAALDAAPDAVAVLLNLSRDQLDRHSETRMLAVRWRDALAAHPRCPRRRQRRRSARRVGGERGRRRHVGRGRREPGTATPPRARRAARCSTATTSTLVVPGVRAAPARRRRSSPTPATLSRRRRRVSGTRSRCRAAPNRGNLAMAVGAGARCSACPATARSPAIAGVRAVSGRYARHQRRRARRRSCCSPRTPRAGVETLDVIDELLPDRTGTVVVAINARGPDGRDPSWLWDVPFETARGPRRDRDRRARDRPRGAARPRRRHATRKDTRTAARRRARRDAKIRS